jgi:16S rRNA (uracil1498-N3)-methyltransferase
VSLVPFVHIDASLAGCAAGDEVELSAQDRHRLTTVLRLRPGAEVELADGTGGWAPAQLGEAGAVLRAAAVAHPDPRPALHVAQGLPKGRKLDDVVRVCTELGADAIVPVVAARSVSRPSGPKADRALERWAAVARAASEQARRVRRPRLGPFRTSAGLTPADGALLVAHPGGAPLPRLLGELTGVPVVTVAVGPEGGWSDEEVARWAGAGARVVGLGPTVLRTEHAAAAALAVLAAALGRWDA